MQEMVYSGFKRCYAFHSIKLDGDSASVDEDTAEHLYVTQNFIDGRRSYHQNEIFKFPWVQPLLQMIVLKEKYLRGHGASEPKAINMGLIVRLVEASEKPSL